MKALLAALALLAGPALGQSTLPTPPPPPKLIVAISVDQFSADLFAEYRNRFTGGFARLLDGAVFPSGYQSHAATETCPGHSTLMTGMRPAHTGIVLNTWLDLRSPLADKAIYCVEDEGNPANTHDHYTVAATHLLAPTLGGRVKAAYADSRAVSVSGKDRAAVMMGGGRADEVWWWDADKRGFATFPGRATPSVVAAANAAVASQLGQAQPALELPANCAPRAQPIAVDGAGPVGAGRFARAAGDATAFRASPELDGATLALAAGLTQAMALGKRRTPDVLTVSLSATDYVGHAYGMQGAEMCLQLTSLDRDLGDFFRALDGMGIDYAVVLTADHGGIDLPERGTSQGSSQARRTHFDATAALAQATAAAGLPATALRFQESNVYADPALSPAQRAEAVAAARLAILAQPDVAAVFSADEIAASPEPSGPPETWPLVMRAKASFYRPRSGDLIVAFQPRVTGAAGKNYVAGHGSFWDYDRRVPILFWRKGMTPFEQPLSIETVDIAPTLAALLHLPLTGPSMDGRCLDLDAGPGSTCP